MKKSKVFVISALSMLMLAACGAPETPDSSAAGDTTSQKASSSKSSTHRHSYGEWVVTKEATCSEKGSKEKTCECGDKKTEEIPMKDHTWGAETVKTAATCAADGEAEKECTACHKKETVAIPSVGHTWGTATDVAATDTTIAYKKSSCTACTHKKIEWNALDGTFAEGSTNKASDNLDGHLKLNSNGNSITYTFSVDEAISGTLYLFGAMDHWTDSTNNTTKTLFSGKNGKDAVEKETSNLKITVGETEVVCTNKKTYGEMLVGTGTFSDDGLMEFGAISLASGLNTITYARADSYNPVVSSLVIVY